MPNKFPGGPATKSSHFSAIVASIWSKFATEVPKALYFQFFFRRDAYIYGSGCRQLQRWFGCIYMHVYIETTDSLQHSI